jgi:hypothetical protein
VNEFWQFWDKRDANKTRIQEEYTQIIQGEQDQSFFSIGLDAGFYLLNNTLPSFKYYYNPNITYEKCPSIIDSQKQYMETKKTMFLIIQVGYFDFYETHFKEFIRPKYTLLCEGSDFYDKNYKFLLFKKNSE